MKKRSVRTTQNKKSGRPNLMSGSRKKDRLRKRRWDVTQRTSPALSPSKPVDTETERIDISGDAVEECNIGAADVPAKKDTNTRATLVMDQAPDSTRRERRKKRHCREKEQRKVDDQKEQELAAAALKESLKLAAKQKRLLKQKKKKTALPTETEAETKQEKADPVEEDESKSEKKDKSPPSSKKAPLKSWVESCTEHIFTEVVHKSDGTYSDMVRVALPLVESMAATISFYSANAQPPAQSCSSASSTADISSSPSAKLFTGAPVPGATLSKQAETGSAVSSEVGTWNCDYCHSTLHNFIEKACIWSVREKGANPSLKIPESVCPGCKETIVQHQTTANCSKESCLVCGWIDCAASDPFHYHPWGCLTCGFVMDKSTGSTTAAVEPSEASSPNVSAEPVVASLMGSSETPILSETELPKERAEDLVNLDTTDSDTEPDTAADTAEKNGTFVSTPSDAPLARASASAASTSSTGLFSRLFSAFRRR